MLRGLCTRCSILNNRTFHRELLRSTVQCRQFGLKQENFNLKDKLYTIPNLLSTARIIVSPFVAYNVLHGNLVTAIILFGIGGLTDMLDGQIARRYPSQRSLAGSILDPVGDKLLMGFTTVACTITGLLPVWLGVTIIVRDVLLLTGGILARWYTIPQKNMKNMFDLSNATIEVKPGLHGKINMCMQLVAVLSAMAAPIWGFESNVVLHYYMITTGCVSVYSLLRYLMSYRESVQQLTKTPEWMEKTQ